MTEEELLSQLNTEIAQSYGTNDSELSGQIAQAMDYYLGEPFGNEEDGQSKVVSTDVQDVIEWVLPSLLRVFTSTDKAVEFMPFDPEDEDAAKQETDIVNHVFYKENNGFFIIYSWFKDALLSKNGIVKAWWEDKETSVREEYSGLNDWDIQQLITDPEIQITEHSEANGLHDVALRRTSDTGRLRIEVIPIEEFRISKDASSVFPSEARFKCHVTTKTRSDLMEMGIKKSVIDRLMVENIQHDDEIGIARDYLEDDNFQESPSEATQEIEIFECYVNIDDDGDGIAELRQITFSGDEILVNEEIEEDPFVAITPIILTHKFHGLSLADAVMDVQLIKSTLMRGVLNNTYLANNQRTAVQDGMVNLDDLLVSRSGGVIRTLGPPSAVMAAQPYNPLPPQTFEVLDKMDLMRKERTGVGQESMGLESNVLAHGRTGVINQSFDQSRLRNELIARIFAEIGMKPLFRKIHGLLQRNQNKAKWQRIRGQWVNVDPRQWKNRSDLSVNVGLGTGNKDKEIQALMGILSIQEKLLPTGQGVTTTNIYNTLEKLVEASGFKDVSTFFTDPRTQPPPQPQPNVEEEILKLQQQIEAQKAETDKVNAETKRMQALFNKERDDELDERERIRLALEHDAKVKASENSKETVSSSDAA